MYQTKFHTLNIGNESFLVTGGAGFIGSNLVEYLLKYGAGKVRVLDDFSTGFRRNIEPFILHPNFELMEGDIRKIETCRKAIEGIGYVSHQAALGSVPRSVIDPLATNSVNVDGFLNMLCAVKDAGHVKRFVYAASSSTYGDSSQLPKVEDNIGKPLSPYAVTKYVNELYAGVFAQTYGVPVIGLRYFNIFGPRQSPDGAYAAVIPLFIQAAMHGQAAFINGDGSQTRDFTFVENAVQANIKAFFTDNPAALNQVYNIACGGQISLNQLWQKVCEIVGLAVNPIYRDTRTGDVQHSLADVNKARNQLLYEPLIGFDEGLSITIDLLRTK